MSTVVNSSSRRDVVVDAVRGVAVFTMVCPNMISLLAGPAPSWLRIYGSFAAPFFIAFAGMMVALTSEKKHYDFAHYLKRSVLLLSVAAFIDVFINGYVPFLGIDVLYLVAASLPLLALLVKQSPAVIAATITVVFVAAPLLQATFGYTDYPTEYALTGQQNYPALAPSSVLQHWFIDGWFPLFPWFGMAAFGLLLGRVRQDRRAADWFADSRFGAAGLATLALGIILWTAFPPPAHVRGDYSEIFYPPRLPHLITACGALMSFLFLARRTVQAKAWEIVRPLGEAPLFFYMLHLAIIGHILRPTFGKQPLSWFLTLSGCLCAVLIGVAFALRRSKRNMRKPLPYFGRFLLGS